VVLQGLGLMPRCRCLMKNCEEGRGAAQDIWEEAAATRFVA
jgi:hypothetical protein